MAKNFTTTGTPAEVVKTELGNPLQSFGVKSQGFSAIRKEFLWTLVCVGLVGYGIFSAIQSINYLGLDYYLRERKSWLIRTLIFAIGVVFWIFHLVKLFTTRAEVFAKGFYLKHGNTEYAYTFKDITHLQKNILKGTNNNVNSVGLILSLHSGEEVKIFGSWTEVMIRFADAVAIAYAQSKVSGAMEQFKKGEKIWFWLLEIDKSSVYFDEKQFSRNEILEIKKARADRYLLVNDLKGKKMAKWDLNKIKDEELFAMLLESVGKKIGA